ncbi:MAG: hypothetical protein SCH98_04355 [Deferrisomatales bacterium]|nr:hypothetical protein [Deferrisomatales bacterium]
MNVVITLSPRDYDAVLFDLDGVLTRTASVHAAAWKKLFDGFLEPRATKAGTPFVPFDIETDYPRHVDGEVCEFVSGTTRVFRLNDEARAGKR